MKSVVEISGGGGRGDKRSERPTGIRTLSLHCPSTQTIFIGQNWKKHCWQIKYLPEHSGLLQAAYMLKLWPVQHKSIFKWLRGHIRWALVMNETLVITSATLTQNSWRPLPISCFQQSATSLVQMSGKPCANYAVMMRVEDLAREFSFHVFFEKASLKRGQYTIYTVHPVTPFGLSCAPFDSVEWWTFWS